MKYLFTLITFLIIASCQTNNQTEELNLKRLCSGKWTMEYVIMENQKTMLPTESGQESSMIFHEDGKHEIMSFGDAFFGEWEYNKKTNSIIMKDDGGVVEQKIEKLTDTELLLSYEVDGLTEKIGLKNEPYARD